MKAWNDPPGTSAPLGATVSAAGVNFSVFSKDASHVMLNAYWEPLTFEIPLDESGESLSWRRCIDTAAAPDDIHRFAAAPAAPASRCLAQPRSLVLLAARLPAGHDRAGAACSTDR